MIGARASEQLRQEREAFDQAKAHDARWFTLRLMIGYAGIALLLAIALISGYILLHPASYSPATITVAATTLLVDILRSGRHHLQIRPPAEQRGPAQTCDGNPLG